MFTEAKIFANSNKSLSNKGLMQSIASSFWNHISFIDYRFYFINGLSAWQDPEPGEEEDEDDKKKKDSKKDGKKDDKKNDKKDDKKDDKESCNRWNFLNQ